jgi:uncharacterized membrane protein
LCKSKELVLDTTIKEALRAAAARARLSLAALNVFLQSKLLELKGLRTRTKVVLDEVADIKERKAEVSKELERLNLLLKESEEEDETEETGDV